MVSVMTPIAGGSKMPFFFSYFLEFKCGVRTENEIRMTAANSFPMSILFFHRKYL